MSDKLAISKGLWAPIATPTRGSPWVIWPHVAMTRKAARESYLQQFDPAYHEKALTRVRFARVTITEDDHD